MVSGLMNANAFIRKPPRHQNATPPKEGNRTYTRVWERVCSNVSPDFGLFSHFGFRLLPHVQVSVVFSFLRAERRPDGASLQKTGLSRERPVLFFRRSVARKECFSKQNAPHRKRIAPFSNESQKTQTSFPVHARNHGTPRNITL